MRNANLLRTLIIMVTLCPPFFNSSIASTTRIGRYSTVDNRPTPAQINPLMAIGQFNFTASVKAVGDAVQAVLQNTGYSLADEANLSSEVKLTLVKPLPLTQRHLGPLVVKDLLTLLMGKTVFNAMVDPLHRTVNFKIKQTRVRH